MKDTIFVRFHVSNDKGEVLPMVALEVRHVGWHGMSDGYMLWDITHTDNTQERIKVAAKPYGDFKVGEAPDRIISIDIRSFAHPVLTKEEFRARFGTGMLVHPTRKHFVPADQMPDAHKT
jgi:hypothetical protein